MIIMLTLFVNQIAYAYDFESGGIYYDIGENNTVSVVQLYDGGYSGNVNIPNQVSHNGITYSVTSIGNYAFYECSGLTSVTIPNSVTSIGFKAFYCCYGLTSVTIPNSVTSIGDGAFIGCGLTSVTISNSVTSIGLYTFYGCYGLTSVTIPNNVTSICGCAFLECRGLTSVTIPNSVTSIDSNAFSRCSGLTSIKVELGNSVYDSRENCNAIIETKSNMLITGCKNTTIPNSVTSIGVSAFGGCSGLTSVTIPNSVTSIGSEAFFDCSSLTSVTIPNSVTSIGSSAFYRCDGLTSVISEIKNPFTINDYVFRSSNDVIYTNATLTVPAGTKAKYQSTAGWKEFKNIVEAGNSEIPKKQTIHVATAGTLPDLISESAKEVIEDLTLTGEINGTDLKLIREMAGCSFSTEYGAERYNTVGKLTVLDLSGVKIKAGGNSYCVDDDFDYYYNIKNDDELPSYAFHRSKLTSFKAPSSVKSIGEYAFSGCSSLSNISNLSSVTSVGNYAFENCSSLPLVAIPSNVKTIGDAAFVNCTGITSVSFSQSVTSIGNSAFAGCSNLTSIYFPNMATSIGSRAFSECSSLTTITSEIESPNSFDDSVFSSATYSNVTLTVPKGKKSLYQLTAGWKNFKNIVEAGGGQGDEIGKTFEFDGIYYWIVDENSVGVQSGYRCQGDVVIPSQVSYNGKTYNVIYIGVEAFKGCNITSITIPNSVTMISGLAFSSCSDLTSVTIPNSVTTIYEEAFYNCSSLSSITIPNSVTTIGHGAFEGCSSLTSIKVEYGNSVYDSRDNCNAIIETTSNTLIAGCKTTTIPNNVISIGGWAFSACSGLTSVTIPNSVTSIGAYAFQYCGLTSVISEIQNPFMIDNNVFNSSDPEIYATATLTVPAGTKSKYQSTAGWNLFQNIVEAAGDEVEFIIDGVGYKGSKSEKTVLGIGVNSKLTSVEIPASVSYDGTTYTVTGIAENAFVGCTMAALVWNVDNALPSNAFSDTETSANFLLYVKDASYAPSSISNVIVNGTISTITLSDYSGQFYCPKSFTANTISFTHNYNMETGGNGKGWETIVLPFDVQTIKHRINGEIVPFAAYSQNSGKKPFWLCSFSNNGFVRASNIKANTPYIIAMPNQSNYSSSYILAGDVTFSAENVTVAATPTFSGTFVPTYTTVRQASDVYALNVVNRYVNDTGGYDAGSKFISKLRNVRPFEAYISDSPTRGIYDINMEDDTTSMDGVLSLLDPDREIDIYTLNGQKIKRVKQCDLYDVLDQLPHGVYIVNGQKVLR